jgi:hypothetical protein
MNKETVMARLKAMYVEAFSKMDGNRDEAGKKLYLSRFGGSDTETADELVRVAHECHGMVKAHEYWRTELGKLIIELDKHE